MEERLVSSAEQLEDTGLDRTLRPRRLSEYVGQRRVKENLNIGITAARQRDEALEHVLLYGPPGLGKTTLAHIIGQEMGVNVRITSGPAIERPGDLAAVLTGLQPGDILFIDEVHRLSRVVEEVLYPAMEEFAIDIVIGKGPGAPQPPTQPQALHPHRRDDAIRDGQRTPARPLWPGPSA